MANTTKASALAVGARVLAPHPITGATATTPRTVTAVRIHPERGVTVYYDDPHGPTFHAPNDIVVTQ